MIKIGEKQFKTAKPSDLDARLVAATGFSSREADTLIGATPHLAAAALMPFLGDDAPAQPIIARAIARGELDREAIRALYAPAQPAVQTKAGGE